MPKVLALQGPVPKSQKDSGPKETKPSLYPVLQDNSSEELIFPPPYQLLPTVPPAEPAELDGGEPVPEEPVPVPERGAPAHGSVAGTRGRVHRAALSQGPADSTVLPLHSAGPPDETGEWPMHYWPFSTSDLYNWRTQNSKFSENPKDLINLLDTVLFTHQPTWDDCQQLLQVLFTTEERERIQVEAQKSVLGDNRQPTQNPELINAAFPFSCPNWNYNSAEVCR
ncbi:uncharacterized protein LOC130679532 [Manis pentadactyla]|uniref:uncharacterized protein LOC130679532 n=1 Tax=Manis pentadactyla TaxID=143292 RepID=UPI00255C862F|nr:uncharacterized protein LOC130679532 [Manis pentadactyla]